MREWGECDAIYRLLVPPPVTVQWRGYTQTLQVRRNPYPPFGIIEILTDGERTWSDHFHSGEHAEHVLARGWRISTPSAVDTLMRRLVRDGKAEIIAGPHKPWAHARLTSEKFDLLPGLDARYTFRGRHGEIDKLI